MIKSFASNDIDFTSNGDMVIAAKRAVVKNEDNGDFILDMECSTKYIDYVCKNRILSVPTPAGYQAFRIKSSEVTPRGIKVKAYHVYYDTANYLINDSYVVDKTCKEALDHLIAATDIQSPYIVDSDILDKHNYRCVRKSLLEAVNVVLERWGGHLIRDNYAFSINKEIGEDNGITIEYRKNLKDITVSYDWGAVCTKLLPVGKEGYTLDELYLYSEIQYDTPYSKTVTFEQSIDQQDYPDEASYKAALRADLIAQGEAYLKVSQYPQVNYNVKAIIEGYDLDIGDTVQVKDTNIGVDILSKVISYEYDCIRETIISAVFGTAEKSLSNLLSSISNEITTAITENNQVITDEIKSEIAEVKGEIARANDFVYVGSNVILDKYELETPQARAVIGAFNYDLIRGIFNGIQIGEDFERAYRVTAQVRTNNSNWGAVGINNYKSNRVRTWGVSSLRGIVGSNYFKETSISPERVVNYSQSGINLYLYNEGSIGKAVYENVTIHGYLIRKGSAVPSAAIADIDISGGTSRISNFIQAENGDELETENGYPIELQ